MYLCNPGHLHLFSFLDTFLILNNVSSSESSHAYISWNILGQTWPWLEFKNWGSEKLGRISKETQVSYIDCRTNRERIDGLLNAKILINNKETRYFDSVFSIKMNYFLKKNYQKLIFSLCLNKSIDGKITPLLKWFTHISKNIYRKCL